MVPVRFVVCIAVGMLLPLAAQAEDPSFLDSGWPFKALVQPPIPQDVDSSQVRTPVDAFIVQKLAVKGLRLSEEASRETLLRRITFDLTGTLPTLAQQQQFLNDQRPGAYERLVDRLMASPEYGERWAQHWLDVVRYAETAGFKSDQVRPNAHQYRDYVIRALNQDLSYATFVRHQIAGDELEPDLPDALIATGMNRLYPEETQASNFKQARQDILDEVTEVTGFAFMGLTMGCAKCHDHKFDEIKQTDFYRLQAFFTPMLPRDDLAASPRAEQQEHARRMAEWEAATQDLRAEIKRLLKDKEEELRREAMAPLDKETQLAINTPAEQRTCMQKQLAAFAKYEIDRKVARAPNRIEGDVKTQYEALMNQLRAFDALKPPPMQMVMALTDGDDEAPPAFLFDTGNYLKPMFEVQPGYPEFLDPNPPEIVRPAHRPEATGRRSALARWLTRPNHPLTARVMANRIWVHHFGDGLVGTPNDFGVMGEGATHPELLDWLAGEFVRSDWSIKHLHRLIVLSSTYRQASSVVPGDSNAESAFAADPENQLLWRYPRQRLDGEAIRNAMLRLSGMENARMFGPSAKPEMPVAVRDSRYAWQPSETVGDRYRRSMYVLATRNLKYPFFTAFDSPDAINSCPERLPTTTAPQALTMLNSDLTIDMARHWAGRLLAKHHRVEGLVSEAFTAAYARPPSADEMREAVQFIVQQAETVQMTSEETTDASLPEPAPWNQDLEVSELTAVVDFCHALLNATEFIYVE